MRTPIVLLTAVLLSASLVSCSEESTQGKARDVSAAVSATSQERVLSAEAVTIVPTAGMSEGFVVQALPDVSYFTMQDRAVSLPMEVGERMLASDGSMNGERRWDADEHYGTEPPVLGINAHSSGGEGRTCDCPPDAGPVDCYL